MKTVGIICEYNPFHNGHLYHLDKVKELYKDHIIVLVMSSSFMQRGEPSIIDKWTKTKIALENGIDIIVELPFPFSTSSADQFATGSISILKHLKVEHLLFGSESGNIDEINDFIEKNSEIEKHVKGFLDEGLSYPKAMGESYKKVTGNSFEKPNDLLAISYLKAIKDLKAKITPATIKRSNDYHDKNLNNTVVSASAIREGLLNKTNISSFVPASTLLNLHDLHFIDDYFPFLKHQILCNINELDKFNLVDEGIENKIKRHILTATSFDNLIMKIKSKRYTYSRLRRMLTHIMCGYTKKLNKKFKKIEYIRVLGFSNRGQGYLNKIKKEVKLPIVTNYSKLNNSMLSYEMQITAIYASTLDDCKQIKLVNREYKNNPKNIV